MAELAKFMGLPIDDIGKIMGMVVPTGVDVSDADALVTDVKATKTFYSVAAPKKTGTLPTKAIAAGAETYEEGYHAGNPGGLSAVDTDLAVGNIKSGVDIFGKVGTVAEGAPPLTVALFQTNPATGTFTGSPQNINDNNTGTAAYAQAVAQYAEVDLGAEYAVRQFRHYGSGFNNGDGTWKIQLHYRGTWYDWTPDFATRSTTTWTTFTVIGTAPAVCSKIRLVCTTVDSGGASYIAELEVIL